jgi:uncharacterized protein YndB with AHSA1/START domain
MTTMTAATTQVYQIFIKATPERVWEAITKPEFVARYFHGARLDPATYEVGSKLKSWSPDRTALWTDNTVLECDPPRRLVHTWRSLYNPEFAVEGESRVTWEVEAYSPGCAKLTVVHDRLEAAPKTAKNVSGGWMLIISGLKTLLETGDELVDFPAAS